MGGVKGKVKSVRESDIFALILNIIRTELLPQVPSVNLG